PPSMDLASDCFLPNAARRVLETFLAFRSPDKSRKESLHAKLEALNLTDVRKSRILRFVDVYSHSDAVGEPEHDPSILSETSAVLSDLLDLMRRADPGHVEAMERLIAN